MPTRNTLVCLLLAVWILPLVAACGSSDRVSTTPTHDAATPTAGLQLPTAIASATPHSDVEPSPSPTTGSPIDALGLCFTEEALLGVSQSSGSFEVDAESEISNAFLASYMHNPIAAEQQLASWERLTGAYRLWTLVRETQSPTKDELGASLTAANEAEAVETQEWHERISSPIFAVSCEVELFLSNAGATAAFGQRLEPSRESIVLTTDDTVTLSLPTQPDVADQSGALLIVHTYRESSLHRFYIGSLRSGNVIAHVKLHGGWCDFPPGQSCADVDGTMIGEGERLLTVLAEQIEWTRAARSNGLLLPEETSIPRSSTPEPSQVTTDWIQFLFPTLFEARLASGLHLVEATLTHEDTRLFEHGDQNSHGPYSVTYRGDGATLVIELAHFETQEQAQYSLSQVSLNEARGVALDVEDIGDVAVGRVAQPSVADPAATAVVVVRIDRTLIGISLQSHDDVDLADAARRLTEIQAGVLVATEILDPE